MCVYVAEMFAIGFSVKKQAFPMRDSVISSSKKKCVYVAEMFANRFSFQKQAFLCVRLQTTILCADFVYSSAKKNVRSCTHGDLKKCVQVVFSA